MEWYRTVYTYMFCASSTFCEEIRSRHVIGHYTGQWQMDYAFRPAMQLQKLR